MGREKQNHRKERRNQKGEQTNPLPNHSHQLRRAGHAHAHLAVVRELDAGVEGGLEREEGGSFCWEKFREFFVNYIKTKDPTTSSPLA